VKTLLYGEKTWTLYRLAEDYVNLSEDKELERIKMKKLRELLSKGKEPTEQRVESTVKELNEKDFDAFIGKADKPVLVDFWAEWCMPCLVMAPIVESLAKKYAGKALFAKVNVDENPGLAMRFGIYGIPTFIIFVNGKEVRRIVGAVGKAGLEAELSKFIA